MAGEDGDGRERQMAGEDGDGRRRWGWQGEGDGRETESQNHEGWERPPRPSSPTTNPTLPCLLNHVPKGHIHTVFEPLQGRGLPHCPGQPGPSPDHSSSEEIVPDIQSEPPLMQLEAIASWPFLLWQEEMGMAGRGGWQGDRITESSRLGKTSKTIKSNHQPNPTTPAQPCPQGPHPRGV